MDAAHGVPVADVDPYRMVAESLVRTIDELRDRLMLLLDDWEPEIDVVCADVSRHIRAQARLVARGTRAFRRRGRTFLLLMAMAMACASGILWFVARVCCLLSVRVTLALASTRGGLAATTSCALFAGAAAVAVTCLPMSLVSCALCSAVVTLLVTT